MIAAASEERFTRKKQDESFPKEAVDFCLKQAGISLADVEYVVFYEKPFWKFERILENAIENWPFGFRQFLPAMHEWVGKKLFLRSLLEKELTGFTGEILFSEHHLSHAASSFYASSFDEAALLVIDGVGEWATTSYGVGKGNRIDLSHEIRFPHSIGLLYSTITAYLGFKVNSGEYKVMGLAPYGEAKYLEQLRKTIDVAEDGSFQLHREFFGFERGLKSWSKKLEMLLGVPPREPESRLIQDHFDLARSLQELSEEIILKMASHVLKTTGQKKLCLAGGVALNCVANGRILRELPVEELFIQPAAGDAGGALGAALSVAHGILDLPREKREFSPYLGPEFSTEEVESFLSAEQIPFTKLLDDKLFPFVAKAIAEQQIVGWFSGRMEFGPRALGNRSILADARAKENWQRVNLKIKFRESFRPFAPSVLAESANRYFDLGKHDSPYMLLTAPVLTDEVPAVTHVDKSARVQTVTKAQNERYHRLLTEFERQTGCGVLINTSFNVRGEPIVCTPADALRCFLRTEMDLLVLGNCIIERKNVLDRIEIDESWKSEFPLD